MKRIMTALFVLLCLMFVILLCGCSKYNKNYVYDGTSLIGKWIDEELNEDAYDVYEFIDGENVVLTTNCRGIKLKELRGTYTVEDNNKIVIQSDFGKEYIRFSVTKKGKLVLLTLNDMDRPSEEERVMEKYNLDYNAGENKLVGTWRSVNIEGEKFVFNGDFTGKSVKLNANGDEIEYKLYYSYKGSELSIIIEYMIGYEEQVGTTEFRVENNVLTLLGSDGDGNDIELIFEREE